MQRDLRCNMIKHAELVSPGVIEVKCRSQRCGARPGVVVIHRFDTNNGELIATTLRFKEPRRKA